MTNARHLRGSAWLNFPRVLCETWSHENIVLMGDAAATAHFSVGSGTKLALESAIALAGYLHSESTLQAAFRRYEDERRTEVLKLQSAARNSTEWFEDVERYLHLDPVQFNYSLADALAAHQPREPAAAGQGVAGRRRDVVRAASTGDKPNAARPPMFTPFRLREMHLKNRIVVSPMAQYRAVDGTPTDWHLVHYAERAKGGAGLVTTEMTCVSPEGRITPGCTGLYAPEHEAAWKRIVDFVHAETDAKIAMQLGHSGAKGSTQLGWEDMDAPLAHGNWEIMAPSPVPWSPRNQVPREMTRADMDEVRDQFVHSAEMAERAGFDMLELHFAHGYLMSAFITPLTNRRTDAYGGIAREPHALSAGGFPCGAGGVAGPEADLRAHLGQRLGRRGRHFAGGFGRDRAPAEAGRRRHHRRIGRADIHRSPPGLRPHVPDAVLRSHPQRGRHRHHGGRQHHRARSRQLDPDGGPRRPVLPRAAAPRRSLLDAARRRPAGLPRRDVAQALSRRTRPAASPGRARRNRNGEGVMAVQRRTAPEPQGMLKLRLWVRLLQAVRVVEVDLRRRLRAEFAETLPRFDVMAALARQKTGMTMTQVSRFLMVSNGNVTGIIDRLVAEGLVVRIANARIGGRPSCG